MLICRRAGVVKLVDAEDSKSSGGNSMSVRFRPPAPILIRKRSGAVSDLFAFFGDRNRTRGSGGRTSPVYIGGAHEGAGPPREAKRMTFRPPAPYGSVRLVIGPVFFWWSEANQGITTKAADLVVSGLYSPIASTGRSSRRHTGHAPTQRTSVPTKFSPVASAPLMGIDIAVGLNV